MGFVRYRNCTYDNIQYDCYTSYVKTGSCCFRRLYRKEKRKISIKKGHPRMSFLYVVSYAKIGAKAAAKASFCACASAKSFPNVV